MLTCPSLRNDRSAWMPRRRPRRVGCCVPLGLKQSIENQLTQRQVPVIQKVLRTVDVPLVQHIDWIIDVPVT